MRLNVSFVAGFLAAVFFLSTVGLFVLYRSLSHDYSVLFSRYVDCSERYTALSADYNTLSAEYQRLKYSYERLSDDYGLLESRYQDLARDYDSLQDVVRSYAVDINYIYQWLSVNGRLSDRQFSSEVRGCLEGDVLNYPCVLFRRGYRYLSDSGDQAKPVSQFISDRGGDCEDYAFYAAALIRTAADKGYLVKFARVGMGRFFLTSRTYYPGAEPVVLRVVDVNVLCGEESFDSENGHCIISVLADDGSTYYVEPQTGMFALPLVDAQYFSPTSVVILGRDLNSFFDRVCGIDPAVLPDVCR